MAWSKAVDMLSGLFGGTINQIDKEGKNQTTLLKKIAIYPLKLFATFILAPFILIKVIINSNANIMRKIIAILGLVLAAAATYYLTTAATILLGSVIFNQLGFFSFAGYIVGLIFTSWLNILIQVGIFNFISTVMLKINQQAVLKYLNELSNGDG